MTTNPAVANCRPKCAVDPDTNDVVIGVEQPTPALRQAVADQFGDAVQIIQQDEPPLAAGRSVNAGLRRRRRLGLRRQLAGHDPLHDRLRDDRSVRLVLHHDRRPLLRCRGHRNRRTHCQLRQRRRFLDQCPAGRGRVLHAVFRHLLGRRSPQLLRRGHRQGPKLRRRELDRRPQNHQHPRDYLSRHGQSRH